MLASTPPANVETAPVPATTVRMALLLESATKMLPAPSTATSEGSENSALVPTPSTNSPPKTPPANVETTPAGEMARMTSENESATYVIPAGVTATPFGELNRAAEPLPSTKPAAVPNALPPPAIVSTVRSVHCARAVRGGAASTSASARTARRQLPPAPPACIAARSGEILQRRAPAARAQRRMGRGGAGAASPRRSRLDAEGGARAGRAKAQQARGRPGVTQRGRRRCVRAAAGDWKRRRMEERSKKLKEKSLKRFGATASGRARWHAPEASLSLQLFCGGPVVQEFDVRNCSPVRQNFCLVRKTTAENGA